MNVPIDFLAAHPLLLLNPRMRQIEFDVPQAWMPAIERMADRMENCLGRLVKAGLSMDALPVVQRIAVVDGKLVFGADFPSDAAVAEFRAARDAAEAEFKYKPSIALEEHRQSIPAIVASCNCTNPRVFGSVLRGTDTFASDFDLLVDPLENTTLLHLGRLQHELSNLLKVRVQVVTPGDLPEKWRQTVLDEARPI